MSSSKFPILSLVKYGALAFAFILGYQFAEKENQPFIAAAGWVLGFIVGMKVRWKYANRS